MSRNLENGWPQDWEWSVFIPVPVKVAQLCPTLCDPMDYTIHGVLQARILEWVAFPFSRGLPNLGIKPRSPALQVDSLPAEPQGKPKSSAKECSNHSTTALISHDSKVSAAHELRTCTDWVLERQSNQRSNCRWWCPQGQRARWDLYLLGRLGTKQLVQFLPPPKPLKRLIQPYSVVESCQTVPEPLPRRTAKVA